MGRTRGSDRRSGRALLRLPALAVACAGTAGMLAAIAVVPAEAAPPAALVRCRNAQTDLTYASDSPARVIAQGECYNPENDGAGAGLWVTIYRNGSVVWSGGNGVGIVTAIYNCQGSAWGDFQAVWSTGASDEQWFPCG